MRAVFARGDSGALNDAKQIIPEYIIHYVVYIFNNNTCEITNYIIAR